jgi:hypothetical protein
MGIVAAYALLLKERLRQACVCEGGSTGLHRRSARVLGSSNTSEIFVPKVRVVVTQENVEWLCEASTCSYRIACMVIIPSPLSMQNTRTQESRRSDLHHLFLFGVPLGYARWCSLCLTRKANEHGVHLCCEAQCGCNCYVFYHTTWRGL